MLVALGEQIIQNFVIVCVNWFESEIVHGKGIDAGKGVEFVLEGMDGARSFERSEQLALGSE